MSALDGLLKDLAREVASLVGSGDCLVELPGPLERKACTRLVRDGTLPAAKIGRVWYAKQSDLLALVDKLRPVAKPTRVDDVAEHMRALARKRAG